MKEIYDEFKKAAPVTWMADYIEHSRVPNAIIWIPKELPMFIEFKTWRRHFPPSQGGLGQPKVLRICNIHIVGISSRIIGRTVDHVLYMTKIDNPYGPHKFIPYKSMKALVEEVQ